MNSRLFNCLKVFDILKKEAKKRGIDKVFINGDVFEENDYIPVAAYDGVYRKLEEMADDGLDVVLNIGNHDVSKSSGRLLHSLRPFRRVATVVERPKTIWERLKVVPYMGDTEILKNYVKSLDSSDQLCLCLHIGVQGAVTGPTNYLVRNPVHLKDVRPTSFGLVLLSDFHTRQQLAGNVFYLGSPLQHSFGEIHKPVIWEVRLLLHPPFFKLIEIPTPFPRFRRVHAGTRSSLRTVLNKYAGDYVSVTIPSEGRLSPEDVEKIAKEEGCKVAVRTKGEEEQEDAAIKLWQPEEQIEKYVVENAKKRNRKRLTNLGLELYQ